MTDAFTRAADLRNIGHSHALIRDLCGADAAALACTLAPNLAAWRGKRARLPARYRDAILVGVAGVLGSRPSHRRAA